MAGDPREAALLTLFACDRQGAWSDLALNKQIHAAGLDSRDAAFATKLCFGVLQNRILCDFYIKKFSNYPIEKMENKVLNNLRLAVYQMAFLTKVPPSAAVNEAVNLTKKHSKNPRSPALVNGILRAFARSLDHLPLVDQTDPAVYLSTRYSHPLWLARTFLALQGFEGAEALMKADNSQPPTVAQVNTLKAAPEQVLAQLSEENIPAWPHPWLENCITFTGAGDLERLEIFREGKVYIQDAAAKLAVMAADPKPGMKVLDACAAPGGKSFAAAIAMGGKGEILACDIHSHKKKLIDSGAQRLGLGCIRTAVQDARTCREEYLEAFDLVLADVPCSGLGIIRKKPDIRYKDPGPLETLPTIQGEILDNLSRYVKPGGTLLYSTCTLLERENSGVVEAFLTGHPEYSLEAFTLPGPIGRADTGAVTLWPHIHGTDGFYIAKLRRAP